MITQTLRRAATKIRDDVAVHGGGPPDVFLLALANLLDNEASLIDSTESHPDLHMPLNGARVDLLLAVARGYLREQQP